ncbi:hypothetical protein [Streptomyces sp. enrichment culture]|uniref:hypothetical protein n=1 Tax=Streptomyces sp. enrichment culture TaxID=1795815 RepID=UPI003F544C0D
MRKLRPALQDERGDVQQDAGVDVVDLLVEAGAAGEHGALGVLQRPGLAGVLERDVPHARLVEEFVQVEAAEARVGQGEGGEAQVDDEEFVVVDAVADDLLKTLAAVLEEREPGRVVGVDEEQGVGLYVPDEFVVDPVGVVQDALRDRPRADTDVLQHVGQVVEARLDQRDGYAVAAEVHAGARVEMDAA